MTLDIASLMLNVAHIRKLYNEPYLFLSFTSIYFTGFLDYTCDPDFEL